MVCTGYKSGPTTNNIVQLPFVPVVDFLEQTFVECSVTYYGSSNLLFPFFFSPLLGSL